MTATKGTSMQLGLVGLGKMGFNMRDRLREGSHEVIGYDPRPEVTDVPTLAALAEALEAPRVVWVMVPSGPITDDTITALADVLSEGDLVIDGGNSRFTEDGPHAKLLGEKGIGFIDAGVSGGIWGLKEGYGLMVGGSDADVARVMPIFDTLRPAGPLEDGFVHAGPVGAGHYAKMVHNGIEYGLMTAYAEGYELLAAEELITDVQAVIQAWTNGTVVRSWLQQLLAKALKEDPHFDAISGYTEDSGEGRWTVEEAINHRVPMPVIAASLFARFASRQDDSPAMKAVSALRNQFGGHAVKRIGLSG
ncbi:phosphogluconate dehydrogenase (NAD(+)-dependent, decarboxylating) [Mycolicibacterium komossense]|uniref:phosphogluconate dehydrogenase (NAD(+)-dependent, decarboxylating) n=1 Tax=Mycolicibacterium komossense TaxID=1779 RepID=UPI003F49B28F